MKKFVAILLLACTLLSIASVSLAEQYTYKKYQWNTSVSTINGSSSTYYVVRQTKYNQYNYNVKTTVLVQKKPTSTCHVYPMIPLTQTTTNTYSYKSLPNTKITQNSSYISFTTK